MGVKRYKLSGRKVCYDGDVARLEGTHKQLGIDAAELHAENARLREALEGE